MHILNNVKRKRETNCSLFSKRTDQVKCKNMWNFTRGAHLSLRSQILVANIFFLVTLSSAMSTAPRMGRKAIQNVKIIFGLMHTLVKYVCINTHHKVSRRELHYSTNKKNATKSKFARATWCALHRDFTNNHKPAFYFMLTAAHSSTPGQKYLI